MQRTRRPQRRDLWIGFVVLAFAGALASLGRLWLGNRAAPGENLWAEDGLFALCIDKAGFFTCLMDPFAGYLLFVPRVLAWPVSILPVEWWAWAANILAAALVGILSGFAYVVARRASRTVFTAAVIALLPAIAPIVGLEAINSLGSSYMPLLYLSTLVLVLVPSDGQGGYGPAGNFGIFALLTITALTIPSALVLVIVLVVQFIRGRLELRPAALWLLGLVAGLVAQAITALTATTPRPLELNAASVSSWMDSVPISILTYWPGISLGEYGFFANFTLAPADYTGLLVVLILAGLGLWQVAVGWSRDSSPAFAVGLLVLAGLAFGFIPSVIGDPNNRYFVVPLLLWGAAVMVALDPVIRRTRWWITALIVALVCAVWWPAMPASQYRSTPAPAWSDEVARMKAKCLADPGFVEFPIFSPYWPPNRGAGMDEPTHPDTPCMVILRWVV